MSGKPTHVLSTPSSGVVLTNLGPGINIIVAATLMSVIGRFKSSRDNARTN
jgi:hypothetical protein